MRLPWLYTADALRRRAFSGTRPQPIMELNRFGLGLLLALTFTFGNGCHKSESAPPKPAVKETAAPSTNVATAATATSSDMSRWHWLGSRRLLADTNAAFLTNIWNLSESARLEAQTLEKLSLAPWRLLKGDDSTNGAPNALLRPLLDDLLREESCAEIRHPTNRPVDAVFAIRLNEDRARLWETNLAAIVESLTGIKTVTATDGRGWSLKKHDTPNLLVLSRTGDWTLLSLAQDQSALLAEIATRIQSGHAPF